MASTPDGMSTPSQVQVWQAPPLTPVRDLSSVATRANRAAVQVWRALADTGGSPTSGQRIRVSTAANQMLESIAIHRCCRPGKSRG